MTKSHKALDENLRHVSHLRYSRVEPVCDSLMKRRSNEFRLSDDGLMSERSNHFEEVTGHFTLHSTL